MRGTVGLTLALGGGILFALCGRLTASDPRPVRAAVMDRVVVAAPIQLMLTGGDRFLAADMEAIRSAAIGPDNPNEMLYRIRSHQVAAQLNPCHEDNYYLANALLTWGGALDEGDDILKRAMECRVWDEYPPLFYGFNHHFFYKDDAVASRAFEIAAERSVHNRVVLKRVAIMIKAGQYKDDHMALDYLKHERDQAKDPQLKLALDKRVGRLEGLIALREAQQRFEAQFKRPLKSPQELLDHHILDGFPNDPVGLGYEFDNGTFKLRQMKIGGMG